MGSHIPKAQGCVLRLPHRTKKSRMNRLSFTVQGSEPPYHITRAFRATKLLQPLPQRGSSSTSHPSSANEHHSRRISRNAASRLVASLQEAPPTRLQDFVRHPAFDGFFAMIVLINCFFIAFEVQDPCVSVPPDRTGSAVRFGSVFLGSVQWRSMVWGVQSWWDFLAWDL